MFEVTIVYNDGSSECQHISKWEWVQDYIGDMKSFQYVIIRHMKEKNDN